MVPEAWLDRPLRHADPHLHRLLRSHPQLALPQSSDSHDLTRRVTDVIERLFAEGVRPAQAIVARRLALSPRTLRRWLEERDTRFAVVLDTARCRVAKRRLSEGARLDEVAEHLGYESTPRSFARFVDGSTKHRPLARTPRRRPESSPARIRASAEMLGGGGPNRASPVGEGRAAPSKRRTSTKPCNGFVL
ncbi:MAG: helix-turn-helix transcriptional regulator [Sandaracinus sp.]|nr:helix-turn-helix transcriptional regulator [Sandaracinus sp.]